MTLQFVPPSPFLLSPYPALAPAPAAWPEVARAIELMTTRMATHGWCQLTIKDGAGRTCMQGAFAEGVDRLELYGSLGTSVSELLAEVIKETAPACLWGGESADCWRTVINFNDNMTTRFPEVLKVLEEARTRALARAAAEEAEQVARASASAPAQEGAREQALALAVS